MTSRPCPKNATTTRSKPSARRTKRRRSRKVSNAPLELGLALTTTGKSEAQGRKNEKLARKNPERIQKQIDDLKAITTNGGKLSKHEEQVLSGLESELKQVKKARDQLGDNAPKFGRGWNRDQDSGGPGVLGKRRRGSNASTEDEDIDEDVKRIPMPRDTPPPIPKEVLDAWYAKRRARREAENAARQKADDKTEEKKPAVEAKTVYSAEPVRRDLRKEAVSAFVPVAVQRKLNKGTGQGGLMEPEEADRLEKEGYLKTSEQARGDEAPAPQTVTMEEVEDEG